MSGHLHIEPRSLIQLNFIVITAQMLIIFSPNQTTREPSVLFDRLIENAEARPIVVGGFASRRVY